MKFERKLQIKIAFGYVVMLAIGISMAFILVHERKRMKNIETETTNIRNVRKSIGVVHRFITELAISGETIIGWKNSDYQHYHSMQQQADSLLQIMKPCCKEYVRIKQRDSLRYLLTDKETHLLHIWEVLRKQTQTDSIMINYLPEVAKRATRVRTIQQKEKGIAGFFGGKKTVQVLPSAQELHEFSDSLITLQRKQTAEMNAYADSLRTRNRTLNVQLNRLVSDLDKQANVAFQQREQKIAEAQNLSVRLYTATIPTAIILLFLSYLTIHRELKRNADEKKKREKLISELQESNAKNEELIRFRRNLIQNVSHELRTPLTAISGNAEPVLQDKEKSVVQCVRLSMWRYQRDN